MKKKLCTLLIGTLLSMSLSTSVFANTDTNTIDLSAETTSKLQENLEFTEKLKTEFPHLSSIIENADAKAITHTNPYSSSFNSIEDDLVTPIHEETKKISDNEELSIVVLSDGSYIAKHWIGSYKISGSSSSGSGYQTMQNASMVVKYSLSVELINVGPFGYTLMNGSYDQFDYVGRAATSYNNHIDPASTILKETASYPAHAFYYVPMAVIAGDKAYFETVSLELVVGSDTFKVYLNGYRI